MCDALKKVFVLAGMCVFVHVAYATRATERLTPKQRQQLTAAATMIQKMMRDGNRVPEDPRIEAILAMVDDMRFVYLPEQFAILCSKIEVLEDKIDAIDCVQPS